MPWQKQSTYLEECGIFCRRLHNLNRRPLLLSLCAPPLPRPKAPRCVPLSLHPRAVAFCASFASPLRLLCTSCLAPLLSALALHLSRKTSLRRCHARAAPRPSASGPPASAMRTARSAAAPVIAALSAARTPA